MGTMSMTAGGTMSMTWMPMPGHTWSGAAASFLGMWTVMMAAMMLPSMAPMVWRFRGAARTTGIGGEIQAALVGLGYLFAWIVLGAVVFVIGAALASVGTRQPALIRAAPMATGAVVLVAGALQLSAWKARLLARHTSSDRIYGAPQSSAAVWRHGLRLGIRCVYSCSALMAIQLVIGMMDLRVMAIVAAAITAERLAPAGKRVARLTGSVAVAIGLALIARAAT